LLFFGTRVVYESLKFSSSTNSSSPFSSFSYLVTFRRLMCPCFSNSSCLVSKLIQRNDQTNECFRLGSRA
jgi:hypothetical protein